MKSWVLAAGLMAAAMSTGAQAADLDEGPPPDRRGSVYDDPRYADIYRYPDRPRPPPYVVQPPPRDYVYRDNRYGPYEGRYGPYEGRRFSYSDPLPPFADRCVPREEIKHRLRSEGWHDFHDIDLQGQLANVRARRPSGRLFDLTIDRCSGEIVSTRPLEPRPLGPYAYGPPSRRWWDRDY